MEQLCFFQENNPVERPYRLGLDIGGTFTDLLVLDERSGNSYVLKTPSTPWPPEAIAHGLHQLARRHGVRPEQIGFFSHGTTLAVNTILERTGARVGLLTTRGYRDILELRRLRLSHPNDFFVARPRPLVPRRHVREIDERILASGGVCRPIRREEVEAAAAELLAEGIEALAICFLHSYRNPAHELAARRWVQERFPDLYVCASAEIWPQQREYERCLISVINAYVGKPMRRYLAAMDREAAALGLGCPIFATRSNGGIMSAASAAERPVETLLSGPASGVIGSAYLGSLIGERQIVAVDMGGTSVDIAVIDGEVAYSTENTVGEFPVIMPAVDVSSIGAGGGSIAWIDAEGVLKVGPRSAGASPGPACYGRGGEHPTLTDAYLVAGLLDPAHFLGGTMVLHPELARAAIARLGERLGLGVEQTADAIIQVTTATIYAETLPQLARRGVDPHEFSLLAYGGAGPTHCFMLARELPVRRVIVPPTPGAMCALGCLAADLRADFVRTVWCDLPALDAEALGAIFAPLDEVARRWLEAERAAIERTHLLRAADMCYVGQSFEIAVPLPEPLAELTPAEVERRFHERYRAIYGYADPAAPARLINARVQAVGVTPRPPMARLAHAADVAWRDVTTRRIFERGRAWEARVVPRALLRPGDRLRGPAIVEQYDTTTYIPAGFVVTVDHLLNLVGERASPAGPGEGSEPW